MKDFINLPARYGYTHKLKFIGNNLWQFEADPKSSGTFRVIGFEGEYHVGINCSSFDPEGGPFLSIGDTIDGKVIKSITSSGIFELE